MTVHELTSDQLTELKQRMIDDEIYEKEGRGASYSELANADSVPDEKVFKRYIGTEFTNNDFFCTVGRKYTYVMRVTETVESTYSITSERKLDYEELEERTEKARVEGKLRFKAVSNVDIYTEKTYPSGEDNAIL